MGSVQNVDMTLMVEKLKLKNLTPDIDLTGMKLSSPEINRPGHSAVRLFRAFRYRACADSGICGIHLSAEQKR